MKRQIEIIIIDVSIYLVSLFTKIWGLLEIGFITISNSNIVS